jgi:hypothetical protein
LIAGRQGQRTKDTQWDLDVGTLPNSSADAGFYDYAMTTVSSYAAYAKYHGMSYGIKLALERVFGISDIISYVSQTTGLVYSGVNWLIHFQPVTTEQYSELLPLHTNYPNHQGKRYALTLTSGAATALDIWWQLYLAEEALTRVKSPDYPSLIISLICLGVQESRTRFHRYNKQYQNLATDYYLEELKEQIRLHPDDRPSNDQMRNLFNYVGEKLQKDIDRFDDETISDLYHTSYRTHRDDVEAELFTHRY